MEGINPRMFYTLGIVCFMIIGFANLYSLYLNWIMLNVGGKISSFAGIAFNFILAAFFYNLRKSIIEIPKDVQEEQAKQQEELNEFLKTLK